MKTDWLIKYFQPWCSCDQVFTMQLIICWQFPIHIPHVDCSQWNIWSQCLQKIYQKRHLKSLMMIQLMNLHPRRGFWFRLGWSCAHHHYQGYIPVMNTPTTTEAPLMSRRPNTTRILMIECQFCRSSTRLVTSLLMRPLMITSNPHFSRMLLMNNPSKYWKDFPNDVA